MKTINNILAAFFALIAIGSLIGVIFFDATHQLFVFAIASVMAITTIADSNKKATV